MRIPKHRLFLAVTGLELLLLLALMVHGRVTIRERTRQELPAKRELVRHLGLTDLAIWTEARYTRHPTQADIFSAFQDLPSALEHFPAGSIVPAPSPARGSVTIDPDAGKQ
jgi:hypothetical protein